MNDVSLGIAKRCNQLYADIKLTKNGVQSAMYTHTNTYAYTYRNTFMHTLRCMIGSDERTN